MKKIANIIICLFCAVFAQAQMVGTPYILYNIPNDSEICQDIDTKGTEFWVTFGRNSGNAVGDVLLLLRIVAGDAAANITLTINGNVLPSTIPVAANSIVTINLADIPNGIGNRKSDVYIYAAGAAGSDKVQKSMRITSTNPVSVYAFNTGNATSDATILLPVEAWGNDYYRLSATPYNGNSATGFCDVEMIIAREANTIITLPGGGTQTLQPFDVYYTSSFTDMSGRHITSNKPVAYFTHTTNTSVPSTRTYGDILFFQMRSADQWGKEFLVPNAKQRGINLGYDTIANTLNNIIRIIASENGTTVNYTGAARLTGTGEQIISPGGTSIASGGTLNAGQWVELLISNSPSLGVGACYITSDKPVGVCAYLVGDGNLNTNAFIGDPSIAWIPPLNETVKSALIAPFYPPSTTIGGGVSHLLYGGSQHFAIIIVKKSAKAQTTITNGKTISWIDPAQTLTYSYGIVKFDNSTDTNKTFKIENPSGVIVMCYGISQTESYYYNAGSGACVIN
ncbi:MAG: IgGFc-binding protein [Prevotellaceae bacterium]|jgi:hypothetical protein|nr:IgGFc-binding protein [Prevotellaceae bacterium]